MPVFMEPMMEADDVIATLARRGEERGLDVFIVTADKDARQLIGDHIRIYNIRKNNVMDAAGLEEEWGIRPDQVVDFLALTGDSVDNVPGVPGIGPGFASTFLKEFGTLDNLLANPGQVKGPKKQQALREHKETALRARQLVALKDDLPLSLDWDALKTQGPDVAALEGPVRSNAGSIDFATSSDSGERPRPRRQEDLGGQLPDRRLRPRASRNSSTSSDAQPRFCIDTETTAIDPLRARLVGLSFSLEGRRSVLPAGPRARWAPRCSTSGDPRGPAADPDRSGRREDRPEHQVRHARAWAARASSWPVRSPTRWS